MSAPLTVDQFVALAVRSGVLDAQRLDPYCQRLRAAGTLPAAPRALANLLVRDGLLTRFQAERLLIGRWRHFVLHGKYRVLEPLGSGGMGDVYLCEHIVMQRRVAVKVLPAARSGNPAYLERFHREARAVAALHHPNIVSGYDVDHDGDIHFLVMEYVDGSNFHKIVKERGPLEPGHAAHYVRQAALGLQHAHEAGLVHRDVKPSNLLLDRTGTVKVLDLGLARFFHDEADDLSKVHAGTPLGTTDFMAPEQATDSHSADIRADIYSLGATCYFLLTGQRPFQPGAALPKMQLQQYRRFRSVRDLRPEVPEGLALLVERMMAREPVDRPQTPAEVADALLCWARQPPPPEDLPERPPTRSARSTAAGQDSPLPLPADSGLDPLPPRTTPPPVADPRSSSTPTLIQVPDAVSPLAAAETLTPPMTQPEQPRAPLSPPRPPKRGRRWAAVAGGILILGAGVCTAWKLGAFSGPPPAPPRDTGAAPRVRLLVPAYFYPGGEGLAQWNRLLESPAPTDIVVIANAANGPGKAVDPNYTRVLERAGRKGLTVVGYVSTGYAGRPLNAVKEDVDRWARFYPGIGGIFFDEQASGADRLPYYAALYDYVRQDRKLALVIGNPGTVCAEEYLARPAADVVCLVETTRGLQAYHPPAWAAPYPTNRFAALISQTDKPEHLRDFLRAAANHRIGYCYITDGNGPNPWGRLPLYWEQEVAAVQRLNEGKAP